MTTESVQPTPIDGVQLEATLDAVVQANLATLTAEERDKLTRVLFPDTDTKEVLLLKVKRELRPLTVKYARKLHALLLPFAEKAVESEGDDTRIFHADDELIRGLMNVASALSDFYGWEDVKKAVQEEDMHLEELQQLAAVQQQLNGTNDFLLAPLRLAVKIMQTRALMDLQVSKGNISITPPSSVVGDVHSTN